MIDIKGLKNRLSMYLFRVKKVLREYRNLKCKHAEVWKK